MRRVDAAGWHLFDLYRGWLTEVIIMGKTSKLPPLLLKLLSSGVLWLGLYYVLEPFSNWLAYSLLRLPPSGRLGSAVAFFAYEFPKVLLLLVLVVFGVGIVRSFFTPEKTRQWLVGRREWVGNVLASLLGIVTPFCSCSAIPLFLGFVETGVPLGVTFSFLISAPMINEIAVVLLLGMFGWKVALLYISTGLAIAMSAGWIIGKMRMERYVESWVYENQSAQCACATGAITWKDRIEAGTTAVKEIVGKVWLYVMLGIAVGAGIHGYVPENFMAAIMGKSAWWSVPLAVLIGVPMYSNAAGIIPIVHALLEKGAALGTVLAFMMAVIGLSLPETIILRKVLKLPLIAVFLGVVATGIIIVGYIFNIVF
jgi:uncharacterized membrane protein YraQ (UPF0718 family)